MKCPKCQFENADTAKFCRCCGERLPEAVPIPQIIVAEPQAAEAAPQITEAAPQVAEAAPKPSFCRFCGAQLKPGAKFCTKCGKQLQVKEAEAPVQPEPVIQPEALVQVEPIAVPVQEEIVEQVPVQAEVPVQPEPIIQPEVPVQVEPIVAPMQEEIEESVPVQAEIPAQPEPSYQQRESQPEPYIQPEPVYQQREPQPEPYMQPEPSYQQWEPQPASPEKSKSKSKAPMIAAIIGGVVVIAGVVAFLFLKGYIPLGGKDKDDKKKETLAENIPEEGDEQEEIVEEKEAEAETVLSEEEINELTVSVKQMLAEGKEAADAGNYQSAANSYKEALLQYKTIGQENGIVDRLSGDVRDTYESYSEAVIAQTTDWETTQDATSAWYQQIENTLNEAMNLGTELEGAGYAVDKTVLGENLEGLPGRYKEKFIAVFDANRTSNEWSRTTTWLYMQEASTVGLVDKNNMNDPLTLRYAYALAWITQRDVTEGVVDGSLTPRDAIDSILSVLEVADYNPVLVRDLAGYYEQEGDKVFASQLKEACGEVWNYLAYTENVYIQPSDLYVSAKTSSASTIELYNFYYFNDFGEYSPSKTNGVSSEGRDRIREIMKAATSSLR